MMKVFICLVFVFSVVSAIPKPVDDDATVEDICSQPPVKPSPLSCLGAFPKWTFNAKTDTCEQYLYGGCGASKNLFSNEYECLAKCNRKALLRPSARSADKATTDPCLLPKAPGTCRAFVNSVYFNAASGQCETFTYTGCRGNDNNFATMEDCQETCRSHLTKSPGSGVHAIHPPLLPAPEPAPIATAVHPPLLNAPGEPAPTATAIHPPLLPAPEPAPTATAVHPPLLPAPGLVPAAHFPLLPAPEPAVTRAEICSLPPVKPSPFGCFGFMPSWTFNSTSQRCESYVYGGCGKTANLFRTEEECKSACESTVGARQLKKHLGSCLLSVNSGPCFAHMTRYAFRKDKNRCEPFTFGGCEGNSNNFKTAQGCFDACGGDEPSLMPECESVTCPITNNRYIDRGCLPVYKEKACCPTSFKCPDEDKSDPVCHYRGMSFKVGEKISMITEDNPCTTHCTCIASDQHTGGATIQCAEIACDWIPKPREGCILRSPPDQCCPSWNCPDLDSPSAEPAQNCTFNGKEYQLGEYIRSGNPCKACSCVEGFSGLDGPGCRDIHCLVKNRIGTVPVYTNGVCCPTDYKSVESATPIIHIKGQPGKQGVVTLPIRLPDDSGKTNDQQQKQDQAQNERCQLPKVIGPCRISQEQFYYNADKGDCELFFYGGCRGNANRFNTVQECRETCIGTQKPPVIVIKPEPGFQGVMTLPIKLDGPSDPAARSAQQSAVCQLPKEEGPCRGHVQSYFYNSETGACESFWFGGCRGNANRFETLIDCQDRCAPQSVVSISPMGARARAGPATEEPIKKDKCTMPADPGFCRGHESRYHFDSASQQCKTFTWGGCLGNANNFATEEECLSACGQGGALRARGGPMLLGARAHGHNTESVCTFGNLTLALGDVILNAEDPCEECICSTPPEITCTRQSCPPFDPPKNVVCQTHFTAGQCCPSFSCVSANPPSINVCDGVVCKEETEFCKVLTVDSDGGSEKIPVGVCTPISERDNDIDH